MVAAQKDSEPILEVKGLLVRFFTRDGVLLAVRDVSFDLFRGESLGIVGESGCGKSVTALSLMRLIPVPPGRIEALKLQFEGKDILKLSENEVRRIRGNKISMIFQDPMTSLNPVLTIGKQMGELLKLHLGLTGNAQKKRAIELLDMVGISAAEMRLKAYPHQLSGGMRQRVMIAMALSCNPSILLADEPTTALDVTIQDQILRLIKGLAKDTGAATVLITHNLGAVAGTTDRIIVMYAGIIVEMASTVDIFQDPLHPYTSSLLQSIPRVDQKAQKRLFSIEGAPPDPLRTVIRGCAFSPRCQFAMEACAKPPELKELKPNHFVSCWKY
jgi:oligopeptide transport system ATP-binding protein